MTGKNIGKRGIAFLLSAIIVISSAMAYQSGNVQAAGKKATKLQLNITGKTLYEGKTVTLKVKKVTPSGASKEVTWISSNKKVATVTARGKVTAKKKGTAKITAVSKSNKKVKAVCKITVKKLSSSAKGTVSHTGIYGKTKWTLYKNGLLEVKGTGDMYKRSSFPEWCDYAEEIKSAKIEVTGATHLEHFFDDCFRLTSVDVSKLDTSKVTDMDSMFSGCVSLKTLDLCHFNTSNVENMEYMFSFCEALEAVDLSNFDTRKVSSMKEMFSGCMSLRSLDLSHFQTSNVTDMDFMFCDCETLKTIDISKFNTSNVTSMVGMFYGCCGLGSLDVSHFDGGKVTDMYNMFYWCTGLTTLCTPKNISMDVMDRELPDGTWEDATGKVWEELPAQSMLLTKKEGSLLYSGSYKKIKWVIDENGLLKVKGSGMVYDNGEPQWKRYEDEIKSAYIEITGAVHINRILNGCANLTTVDIRKLDTSKVTDLSGMFYGCRSLVSLDLSHFQTGNATNMSNMFFDCKSLNYLDVSGFDTSKVTNMSCMFDGCENLTSIDMSGFDTSRVTNMSNMFYECENLTSIDMSGFDISKATNISGMISYCYKLATIYTPKKTSSVMVELPWGKWKDENGKAWEYLPANAVKSVMLTKEVNIEDNW